MTVGVRLAGRAEERFLCAVSGSPAWRPEPGTLGSLVMRGACLAIRGNAAWPGVSDGDGDPALLVPLADVGVSLDDLLQRIAAVDDGAHVPCFDQVRERREAP